MKRVHGFLAALVGLGVAVYVTGQLRAQTPGTTPVATPAPAPRTDKPRVAVFNVARVMKDFQKWQYFAKMMEIERLQAASQLAQLRNEIQTLEKQLQVEVRKEKQEEIQRSAIAKQREFDDKERAVRKSLDTKSADHLKTLFNDIDRTVKAVVDSNAYDIVFAYPDAVTTEEANSPLYYDLKMRPQAAMPFYVSKSVDVTDVVVATLNRSFPAPGPIPQLPPPATGATGTPSAGTTPAGVITPTGGTR